MPRSRRPRKTKTKRFKIWIDTGDEDSSSTTSSSEGDGHRSTGDESFHHSSSDSDYEVKPSQRHRWNSKRVVHDYDSDSSTSGSEINTRIRRSRMSRSILSEDEARNQPSTSKAALSTTQPANDEPADTDTSSGSAELLEKCPICLLSFRQQEVGRPEKCDHKFCAQCIHEWSKNVQTCPIDRIEFESIIVFKSFEDQTFTRKIQVDKIISAASAAAAAEEDSTQCQICERADREEVMLLCDRCDQGYHMDCLSPALTAVPAGSWYCDNCFSDEDDDPSENIDSLYDGLREMGIPESSLTPASLNAPRVLRTRLNERIQAEIFNQRRYNLRTTSTTTTTTTTEIDITRPSTSREIQMRSVSNVRMARDTTENIMRLRRRTLSIMRRTKRRTKRRRRQKKPKTKNIVVEYDLENDQDKKFATKTKKVTIRRRKSKRSTTTIQKRRRTTRSSCKTVIRVSSTAHEQGSSASSIVGSSFSLFGGRNDLEYFEDEDESFENIPTEIEIATSTGGGIASSIRVSNYRTRTSNLLRGKSSLITPSMQATSVDLLSNILEMQERWENASLDKVEIGKDGKLNLNKASPTKKPDRTPENKDMQATEAPMYPRGGNSSFNRGSGNNFRFERGSSRGNYNSRHSTGNTSYNNSGDSSTGNFNSNSSGFNQNNNNGGGNNFNNSFSGFSNNRFNRNNRGGGNRNTRNNTFRPRGQPPLFQTPNMEEQPQAPPSLLNLSFPSDINPIDMNHDEPEHVQLMSVPPPPIPPPSFAMLPPPLFNSSLQNLSAYDNDDNDDGPDEENHCPNESIYSAETIKIFSQTENIAQPTNASIADEIANPMDCDEDLVQYDDDEEIPNVIGPQLCPPEDLYSPARSESGSDEIPLPPQVEHEVSQQQPFIGPLNYTDLLDNIELPEGEPSDELDKIVEPPASSSPSDNDAEVEKLTTTKEKDVEESPVKEKEEEQSKEIDRSYTPCLDEKSEVEEEEDGGETPKELIDKLKNDEQPNNTLDIETELISDDGSLNSLNNKENERGGDNSRQGAKDRENRESFKKVKNQHGRNYRADNQITTGRRRSRTRSRSRSRSRSSDYYRRRRERRRSRSRSRSNDRYNSRNSRHSKVKRKDIPRYDVRNVINSRPQIDRFGRQTNRKNSQSRSRSPSISRVRKRRNSRSSSRRNFRKSISISPRRRISRSPRRLNGGGAGKRYSVSPYKKNRRSHSMSRSGSYTPIRNRRSLSRRSRTPSKHRPVKRKRSKEPKKKKREKTIKKKSHHNTTEQPWSPSPSPELTPPHNAHIMSWTPVAQTPPLPKGGISKRKSLKDKKEKKKVKKTDKKEKKTRKKRASSPPSKEVFASGNNILVSVSFGNNQSSEQQQPLQKQQQQQTTIVTVPPTREEVVSGLLGGKRDKKKSKKEKIIAAAAADISSKDNNVDAEQKKSRKKIDAKPVAIIDLERSPFQITQSNSDVIILTDSDGAVDDHVEHEKKNSSIDKDGSVQEQGIGIQKDIVDDRQFNNNEDDDDDESQSTTTYGQALLQMGPKTPPEPTAENLQPNVKFSIGVKKSTVNSRNPLHDEEEEDDGQSTDKSSNLQQFLPSATSPQQMLLPEPSSIENISKIGPNTPPDSAPCSPDVYDPFEPTKSPSGSEEADDDRDKSTDHEIDIKNTSLPLNTSQNSDEDRLTTSLDLGLSTTAPSAIPGLQILTNTMISNRVNGGGSSNKSAAGANSSGASVGGGGASSAPLLNVSVNELLNNSPYSPGSDDYEDLFEPPVDRNKNRQPPTASNKRPSETFDTLFGSSSPPAAHIKAKQPINKHHSHSRRHHKSSRRTVDDMPGSATELNAKDKLIKKLNRHERVVDEVKIVLKPHYMKKHISREDYKEIMKRSIPKIMHSRSGEINPTKIKNLIEAYVKKFRQKNKLNLLTTQGQVSSAVKCAAYLKKL